MKQKNVIIGNSYLFFSSECEHKRDLINNVVTVVGKMPIKTFEDYEGNIHKRPIRFRLSNGRYCNASNIREL